MCPRIRLIVLSLFLASGWPLGPVARAQSNVLSMQAEDSVRSLIAELPEVKALDHVYDSLTNRTQTVIIKVSPPDTEEPFYRALVGYEGGSRFNPHFYLYVDLPSNTIYIEDLEYGDRTTLGHWRKRRSLSSDSPR